MKLRKQRAEPAAPQEAKSSKPAWQDHLDPQERPSREDKAASHDPLVDSVLEPVPLPRWMRGRKRRTHRDKLS